VNEKAPISAETPTGARIYTAEAVRTRQPHHRLIGEPNALVRFDPATEKFQTWGIPSGGGMVRTMMVTRDGDHLVIAESGIDKVGLVTVEREEPVSRSH
jgi:hypothetical protein